MSKLDLFRGLGFWRSMFDGPTEVFDSAVWATSYAGTRWYGHFLRDEIVSEELARPLGRMIGHVRPTYAHEPGWRDRLQAPRPSTFGVVQVGELTWIDDIGQHPEKRQRYQILRGRLSGLPRGHERILFMRGRKDGEERRMINEAAVVDRLVQEGFHVIDPSLVEVDEILRRGAGASLIVTVEGSHASPIPYFAREGATVVYLYPPSRVSLHSPRLAGFFGLRGAMFIGEPVSGSRGLFKVDPEELVRTLDQAEAPRCGSAPSAEMRCSSTG